MLNKDLTPEQIEYLASYWETDHADYHYDEEDPTDYEDVLKYGDCSIAYCEGKMAGPYEDIKLLIEGYPNCEIELSEDYYNKDYLNAGHICLCEAIETEALEDVPNIWELSSLDIEPGLYRIDKEGDCKTGGRCKVDWVKEYILGGAKLIAFGEYEVSVIEITADLKLEREV